MTINSAWTANTTASSVYLWPNQYTTVTVTTNADVGPTPYYLRIYDEIGTRIAVCGSGTSCAVDYQASSSGSNLVAFVAPLSTTLPPAGAQAASPVITATYLPPPR